MNDLAVNDHRGLPAVQGLSFCVHAGEILGLAGIEGNGQSELIEALTGLCRPSGGRVTLNEKDLTNASPAERLTAGLGHVPEDRLLRGLISDFTVEENVVLGYHRQARFQKRGLLQTGRIADYARKLVKAFDIRTAGITTPAGSLSGGNQQKVVLAARLQPGADCDGCFTAYAGC